MAATRYNIYHGQGSADLIDWGNPVACVSAEPGAAAVIELPLAAGARHFLAARAVSVSGVETTACAIASAEVDEGGNLLPAGLPTASDLAAVALPGGEVILSFSCNAAAAAGAADTADPAVPDAMEILTDRGTGVLDLESPILVLTELAPRQSEFSLVLAGLRLPSQLAVRARRGGLCGPVSPAVTVAAIAAPRLPIVLPCA